MPKKNKDASANVEALAKALRPALKTLVDDYARARAAKTAAEKDEARLRKQLIEQFDARKTNYLAGAEYEVLRSFSGRDLLDGDSVRALLTPDQIKAVTKTVEVTNLTTTKRNEVVVRSVA